MTSPSSATAWLRRAAAVSRSTWPIRSSVWAVTSTAVVSVERVNWSKYRW